VVVVLTFSIAIAVLGTVIFLAAPASRTPTTPRFLGVVIVVAGVVAARTSRSACDRPSW
jgi:uncharacterized membrane protein HdeD (DUF308 family)